MKKTLFLTFGVLALGLLSFAPKPERYYVDTAASRLKWTGYHLAKSYAHWGYVNLESGALTWDAGGISSGEFVIDMASLSNQDVEEEKDRAKLEGHLKSADFFAVDEFPTATLTIRKSTRKAEDVYETVADLTIKGITRQITFDTKVKTLDSHTIEATADFRVNRTDFKVMYGWSLENTVLDGEFRMEVSLVARK